MANRERYPFDETKFKPKQREAALALVEYEFSPKGQRKTKQEIADELGITRQCLHKWDTQDQNFINYKNYLASDFMDTKMAFVYSKLLESVDRGSVRAMELFMKRMGDLTDQTELTINAQQGGEAKSFEEKRQELLERLGKVEAKQDEVEGQEEAKEAE